MKLPEKRIKQIVSLLQNLYLSISIILVLLFILSLRPSSHMETLFIIVIGAVLSFSLYFGLSTKQPWIAPVMVVLSFLGIVSNVFVSVTTVAFLVIKTMFLALNLFELFFFTRKDVKKYFKVRGNFLFGL